MRLNVFIVKNEVLDVFEIATAFFAFLLKRLVVVENLVIRKVCKCKQASKQTTPDCY